MSYAIRIAIYDEDSGNTAACVIEGMPTLDGCKGCGGETLKRGIDGLVDQFRAAFGEEGEACSTPC